MLVKIPPSQLEKGPITVTQCVMTAKDSCSGIVVVLDVVAVVVIDVEGVDEAVEEYRDVDARARDV